MGPLAMFTNSVLALTNNKRRTHKDVKGREHDQFFLCAKWLQIPTKTLSSNPKSKLCDCDIELISFCGRIMHFNHVSRIRQSNHYSTRHTQPEMNIIGNPSSDIFFLYVENISRSIYCFIHSIFRF